MDNERIRAICLSLPHVCETLNWDHVLVYWAGPREIGGKMFALTDVDGTGGCVLSFHAGEERYHELLEMDGVIPAPHLARAYWVGLERWNALRPHAIEEELRRAHGLVMAKLPRRTQSILALPEKERNKILAERRRQLAAEGKASPLARKKRAQPSE
jgi:predicted DNA-binding protein (MmcQ/YjbR family)